MDAKDPSTLEEARDAGRGRRDCPVGWLRRANDLTEKRLPRHTEEKWTPERAETSQPSQELEIVRVGFSESDSGIDHDPFHRNAGRDRRVEPEGELVPHLFDYIPIAGVILHRCGCTTHVHQDQASAPTRHHRSHRGVAECRNVVDDIRADVQRRPCHGRPSGVDGDRYGELPPQLRYDGNDAVRFLVSVHGNRPRTRRFAPDVDHGRALFDHLHGAFDRVRREKVSSTVAEGVGRDVQNAHENRGRQVDRAPAVDPHRCGDPAAPFEICSPA